MKSVLAIERILQSAVLHGDVAAVVRADRVADLRRDLDALGRDNALNDYQRFLIEDVLRFDPPDLAFAPRSIVVIATPSLAARMTLTWQGKGVTVMIPPGYVGDTTAPDRIARYQNEVLGPLGYRVEAAPRLPRKLLAVRSGLARYGRNNICYVEGMGSLLSLYAFYCDAPCEDDAWHALRHLDSCDACEACVRACPTGAILPDRFLIDNARCLACLNEVGAEQSEFPAWVSPSAHHTAYGCARCIDACPANRPYVGRTGAEIAFSEDETAMLLEGYALEDLPDGLKHKVEALDMAGYLGALPRNLRALGVFSVGE